MKIRQITLAISLMMGIAPFANAQDRASENNPIVEISAGVKTFYLDRMGFDPNESLSKVYDELDRFNILGKYSYRTIMVNGEVCRETSISDRILVSQIECIQFITDGNMGYDIGNSGCINIILKKIEEGTHGNVTFSMDTKANHTPAGNITRKSGKWTMWASAYGNILETKNSSSFSNETEYPRNSGYLVSSRITKSYSEATTKTRAAAANLGFRFEDEKNTLTFNVSDSWRPNNSAASTNSYDKISYEMSSNATKTQTIVDSKQINNYFFASADFKHIFSDKVSLMASLSEELNNNPYWRTTVVYQKTNDGNSVTPSDINTTNGSMTVATEAPHSHGYKTSLDAHLDIKASKNLNLKTGIHGVWHNADESGQRYYSALDEDNLTLVPYALASLNVGNFTFNAGERVVFRNMNYGLVDYDDKKHDESCNNTLSVTNASINWRPAVSHQVLASYKKMSTISSIPYQVGSYYDTNNIHRNELTYSIYNTTIKNDVFDLSYAYAGQKVSASITATYRDFDTKSAFADPKDVSDLASYLASKNNNDINHKIYSVDASAVASFGALSLNGDVNYSHVDLSAGSKSGIDTYHYWNVQLTPVFSLPCGFMASATATYTYCMNPSSYKPEAGDDLWCTLRVSKSWKNVEAFVKWENALYNKYEYTVYSNIPNNILNTKYDYMRDDHMNQVTFGASYRF